VAVRVDSEIPVGSGFGSSAAVAVAVVAAYRRLRGVPDDDSEVARLVLEVERRQHGLPSGVDHAAVLCGGVVWAERDGDGELAIEPLPGAAERLREIRIYDSGAPGEATGRVVEAVRERLRRRPTWAQTTLDAMERCVRDCRRCLSRGEPGLLDLIRAYQAALDRLGVVPDRVRAIVRAVEALGGAAKITGAGSLSGDGAGSLLVLPPRASGSANIEFIATEIADTAFATADGESPDTAPPHLAACRRIAAEIGVSGLRLETLA
jgi:mevalonate kinase